MKKFYLIAGVIAVLLCLTYLVAMNGKILQALKSIDIQLIKQTDLNNQHISKQQKSAKQRRLNNRFANSIVNAGTIFLQNNELFPLNTVLSKYKYTNKNSETKNGIAGINACFIDTFSELIVFGYHTPSDKLEVVIPILLKQLHDKINILVLSTK